MPEKKKKKKKPTVKVINVKKFNRYMYDYIDDLPLIVENANTKQAKFIVLPPNQEIINALTEGGEEDGKI